MIHKDVFHVSAHREGEGVHLHQHLTGEEGEEDDICKLLEVVQPCRLVVVLGRLNDDDDDDDNDYTDNDNDNDDDDDDVEYKAPV